MALKRLRVNGMMGYQWAPDGRVYPYEAGNERSRLEAKVRAEREGRGKDPKRPSPRRYVRDLERYAVQMAGAMSRPVLGEVPGVDGRIETDLEADALRRAMRSSLGVGALAAAGIALPTEEQIARHGGDAWKIAARSARRGLLRAGMSRRDLARRLGISVALDVPSDRIVGIDIAPSLADMAQLHRWTADNVALIKRLTPDLTAGLDKVIADRVRRGVHYRTLTKEIVARTGTTKSHARLIARDQVGKLTAEVTASTQDQAGVQKYIWRTVRDERVRGTPGGVNPEGNHYELEGTTWASGGEGAPRAGAYDEPAHPGTAIQCRCYREPVISGRPQRDPARRSVETLRVRRMSSTDLRQLLTEPAISDDKRGEVQRELQARSRR